MAHVSLKHQAFFTCLLTFQKFCNLHNDAMQKLRGRSLLRKCSPRKANPSPLSDSSSLLIVVCMEDKEKKVGLVWMISLRGVVWRVSVFFVVLSLVLCFVSVRLFFLVLFELTYDRWTAMLPQTSWTNLVFVWRHMQKWSSRRRGVHFSHSIFADTPHPFAILSLHNRHCWWSSSPYLHRTIERNAWNSSKCTNAKISLLTIIFYMSHSNTQIAMLCRSEHTCTRCCLADLADIFSVVFAYMLESPWWA